MQIKIKNYQEPLGGSDASHKLIADKITPLIKEMLKGVTGIEEALFYPLDGRENRYGTSANSFHIFLNATPATTTRLEKVLEFGEIRQGVSLGVVQSQPWLSVVKDDADNVVMQFDTKHNDLYIPFEMFKSDDSDFELFKAVTERAREQIFKHFALRDSWKMSTEKERLVAILMDKATKEMKEELENYKSRILTSEERIRNHQQGIHDSYKELIQSRKKVEILESGGADDKFVQEIELIANHPRVSDVVVKNDLFEVFVPNVVAHTEKGRRYAIGDMSVKIKYGISSVRFFNHTNTRQGYWTNADPHPHVNGGSGNPCLGNVASTIAELSAQKELYALFLTALDYMESVNTDDPAGERVRNWDEIDEDGNIIEPEPEEEQLFCYVNEEHYPESEMTVAYLNYDHDQGLTDEVYVHTEDIGESFTYWEPVDHYVHDNVSYDDFFDENGEEISEEDLVIDYNGNRMHKDDAKRAYMKFSFERGVEEPVFVHEDEIGDDFIYWESLGEHIHDSVRESDFYDEAGNPLVEV